MKTAQIKVTRQVHPVTQRNVTKDSGLAKGLIDTTW